jgi:very-short-patch-repair endonuclease
MAAGMATRQYGLISRTQASMIGFSGAAITRRVKRGRWERLYPSVYRIGGAPEWWHQRLMAACLWAGPDAVVSHRAAGALWELDGVPDGAVEISTAKRVQGARGIRVHQTCLSETDTTRLDALPVTTVARTIIDLASVLPEPELEHALDSAIRKRMTTLEIVVKRAESLAARGRRGTVLLHRVLGRRLPGESGPESVLERKLLRVLEDGGLPRPIPQYRVYRNGRVIARLDFAYPDLKIGIEADGFAYHSSRLAWEHDRARRTELTSVGWHLLSFTWDEVEKRPAVVAARVRAARRQFSADLRPEGETN